MTTWTRWFAWRPVELQRGGIAWLCFVECEQFKIDFAPYMLGSPHTVTHYRMADATLKGNWV